MAEPGGVNTAGDTVLGQHKLPQPLNHWNHTGAGSGFSLGLGSEMRQCQGQSEGQCKVRCQEQGHSRVQCEAQG